MPFEDQWRADRLRIYADRKNIGVDSFLQYKTISGKGNQWVPRSLAEVVTDLTELIQDLVGAMVSGNTETGITVTYEDSDGTLDFVVSQEFVEDIIGAMVSGNTETGISVTYDDSGGKLNFAVTYASQANQEALASNVAVSPNVQHFHPSACKAWGFLIVGIGLASGYNVSSVSTSGAGIFTYNWATSFSSASYVARVLAVVTPGGSAATTYVPHTNQGYPAGSVTGTIVILSTFLATNPGGVTVTAFGDL